MLAGFVKTGRIADTHHKNKRRYLALATTAVFLVRLPRRYTITTWRRGEATSQGLTLQRRSPYYHGYYCENRQLKWPKFKKWFVLKWFKYLPVDVIRGTILFWSTAAHRDVGWWAGICPCHMTEAQQLATTEETRNVGDLRVTLILWIRQNLRYESKKHAARPR